jgi:hypothetical protein
MPSSSSRLRLELVLGDILARELGKVPAIVEGPQLMPGFADQLPPGWGVWLVPDPARTRLVREDRLAKEEALAGRPVAGRFRLHRLLRRDALIPERIRASAALSGRPVIEVPPSPDWPAIAAAVGPRPMTTQPGSLPNDRSSPTPPPLRVAIGSRPL